MASVVAVQRSASSAALVLRLRRPTRALRCSARTVASSALDAVKAQIASAPVVVFSKTYCPCVAWRPCPPAQARGVRMSALTHPGSYCTAVKGLFNTLNVKATVIELDKLGA
jgi:hypothetical protein